MTREYRIRWAVIETGPRYAERRCIAERRFRFHFGIRLWFPCLNGDWRHSEEAAQKDIEKDMRLYAPLPATKYVRYEVTQ